MLLFKRLKEVGRSAHPTRAELRVAKDVHELSYSRFSAGRTVTRIHFPEGSSNLTKFVVTICPKEGSYCGGSFVFDINVSRMYPYEPPRVKCRTKVFHPNIDWRTGELSIGLLTREVWIPVLSINAIMFQLQVLFIAPESDLDHAINKDCKQMLESDIDGFHSFVGKTLRGGEFFGVKWEANVSQSGKVYGNKRLRGKPITRGKRRKRTSVDAEIDSSSPWVSSDTMSFESDQPAAIDQRGYSSSSSSESGPSSLKKLRPEQSFFEAKVAHEMPTFDKSDSFSFPIPHSGQQQQRLSHLSSMIFEQKCGSSFLENSAQHSNGSESSSKKKKRFSKPTDLSTFSESGSSLHISPGLSNPIPLRIPPTSVLCQHSPNILGRILPNLVVGQNSFSKFPTPPPSLPSSAPRTCASQPPFEDVTMAD